MRAPGLVYNKHADHAFNPADHTDKGADHTDKGADHGFNPYKR